MAPWAPYLICPPAHLELIGGMTGVVIGPVQRLPDANGARRMDMDGLSPQRYGRFRQRRMSNGGAAIYAPFPGDSSDRCRRAARNSSRVGVRASSRYGAGIGGGVLGSRVLPWWRPTPS